VNVRVQSAAVLSSDEMTKIINKAVKDSVSKGFFYETALHAAKELVSKFIEKGFNWIFDFFYNYQKARANQKTTSELDTAEQGLVYPLETENAMNTYQEAIVRNLYNGTPLFNLLMVGPAGTGKTTGATRIAKYIEARIKEMGNSININEVKIFIFQGGSIYAKGITEATNTLVQNIETWKEESKNNLVFIILDEMEVLFPDRELSGNSEKNDLVTTFLSFTGNAKKNIIIVGATNHESVLDSAVRRRFTQVIQVKAPDTQARIKILKMDIDYYLNLSLGLVSVLNSEQNTHKLLYIAERLVSMSGADIDNLAKRAVESGQSSLGFLTWAQLMQSAREEVFKKATFSRKLTEDEKNEISRLLFINIVSTIFDQLNPFFEFSQTGINYEELVLGSIKRNFHDIFHDPLSSLINYVSTSLITTKGVSYGTIQNLMMNLQGTSYLFHKYSSPGSINFNGNLMDKSAQQWSSSTISIDQNISKSIPSRNAYINNIPKSKESVLFTNNNHKSQINKDIYKARDINSVPIAVQ
jgi:hypothetical protein